jgi:hypothetical protein
VKPPTVADGFDCLAMLCYWSAALDYPLALAPKGALSAGPVAGSGSLASSSLAPST